MTQLQQDLAAALPDAVLPRTEIRPTFGGQTLSYADALKGAKRIETSQKWLEEIPMDPVPAVVKNPLAVTEQHRPKDLSVPELYSAGHSSMSCTKRSYIAGTLARLTMERLPGTFLGEQTRKTTRDRFADTGRVFGSPWMALGRLIRYYPKGLNGAKPPLAREVDKAVARCGISTPSPYWRKLELFECQTVSQSSCGLPNLGKMENPHDALVNLRLAYLVREEVRSLSVEGATRWLRAAEVEMPWLTTLLGKLKEDCYKKEKVQTASLRLYNVVPRPLVLNMQIATQVLEAQHRNILDDPALHTAQGVNLAGVGCAMLVEALETQLDVSTLRVPCAWVHVGDDSWFVVLLERRVLFFAMDCSSFDITQHSAVTHGVHVALRDKLAAIDPAAAGLWFGLMRERNVVTTSTLTRRWTHAGPSGMPLQSKVNDVLMDIALTRLAENLQTIDDTVGEGTIEDIVQATGRSMGFTVRLETYAETHLASDRRPVVQGLVSCPFLFVGYYFHVRDGHVRVYHDVPRTLAQLVYPHGKYEVDKKTFERKEIIRLASTFHNFGVPPAELDDFHECYRRWAIESLNRLEDGPVTTTTSIPVVDAVRVDSVHGLAVSLGQPYDDRWLSTASRDGLDTFASRRTGFYARRDEMQPVEQARFMENVTDRAVWDIALVRIKNPPPVTRANDGRQPGFTPLAVKQGMEASRAQAALPKQDASGGGTKKAQKGTKKTQKRNQTRKNQAAAARAQRTEDLFADRD